MSKWTVRVRQTTIGFRDMTIAAPNEKEAARSALRLSRNGEIYFSPDSSTYKAESVRKEG